jgi:tetratricopeptide (TPR) repeat protein
MIPILLSPALGMAMILASTSVTAGQNDRPQESVPTLETVRRAYIEGRDKEVLVMVERALVDVSPIGDLEMKAAELYFWKGSSLRRLGRHEEALIAFDHAKKLGYAGAELYIERSLTNKTLGKGPESEQDFQEAERRIPPNSEERELYLKHWKWDASEQPRFQLWITPQAGWDSNVIGLDPGTPLLQGKPTFDSYYAGAYLDTKFFLVQNERQLVWVEFQLLGREYPEEQDVSFLDNVFSLTGRQPLSPTMDLELRGSWEEAFLRDTGHFRTQRTIGPALLVKPLEGVQVRLWGDWTDASYYESVPAPQDRDGTLGRLGTMVVVDLGRSWSLAPSASVHRSRADGSDYDYTGWEVVMQGTSPEISGFRVIASVSYGQDDYRNPNSLTAFTEKRKDRIFGTTVTIIFKQVEKWVGYAPSVSVGYVKHDSNIGEFAYDHWTPQIELSLGVLSF